MKREKNKSPILKKVLWFFYALCVAGIASFSIYHLLFAKTVIPGITVKNARLGKLSFAQAILAINSQIPENRNIQLTYNERVFDIKAQDIALKYSLEDTAKTAFKVGRDKKILENSKAKMRGIFGTLPIKFSFSYNENALNNQLANIANLVETPHKDASFALNSIESLVVIPEEKGEILDKETLKTQILENFSNATFSDIPINTSTYEPKLTRKDLEKEFAKVDILINNLPIFVFNQNSWKITKNDFLQMVVFSKKDNAVIITGDKERAKKFVISIAEQVNRPPRGEIFKMEGEKVVGFRLPAPGYVVKEHSAGEIFSLVLLDSSMERQIDLPVEEFFPSAANNSYGIRELIGEGKSTFLGSVQGRVFNITLSAKNLNGILVAPDETFSFNANVGPIDAAHGFTSAYIISKGRTVLGEGGGVCQVSTTLFRAVLNSGLPIISRTAHAYRVGYYEQDKPVGFDATVYQPTVDFKFKNDTGNYILIQSEAIPEKSELYFKIYGTKDGREVKTLESKILSQTPPPAPLYQDDPSLPKGTTKQVEWSAWGAVTKLTRLVEKNGKPLYEDTFISNYQPWRAIYLVGAAE
ncbi:hypothetical protein COT69_00985 [candidate division WWE3 bacterium CG09_land_8_20_14_0_10_39_24]|uniref:YoaR-like putative peptidoglycan binding domain-containing protein n=2 Tax=Katanobacteria TaxID=422282 RepID=A0A2G9XBW6_UNCKA|nr:MAG: hypothetical protein AUJ94_00015 [bacterium CG2_30_40_12]OJI09212.1 MAG: hypothetical protein BK003_00965 [bacterium CG09_39_24]PIP04417.1 MAG: hypothetical protein COX53_02420 [candidate division WWE3 bacterium CG23_combo_of_CG06-09_8_20_14_all_40_14]PIS12991.1 MAG: hypothetical protein COT69_00985 [candidate division WWE3 bacterium CG09_land_8_20_14_0_10_39_24]PJE52048.1 MAG: hypothetical protein COV27_00520 [candidate division WWE3 bacterium CG10_big_fil_rev_8_21_14_0_10_39_14]